MKFHHLGFIVEDIEKWEKSLIYSKKLIQVVDPLQNAILSLYENYESSYIELIQPLNESAFTWNALQKNGNHFHHLCYEVDKLEDVNSIADKYNLILILGPIPALMFESKNVIFYFNRNKQIVEFLINNS